MRYYSFSSLWDLILSDFVRQRIVDRNLVSLFVPQDSNPPHQVRYHYIPYDEAITLLDDGALVSDGIFEFLFKEGVLGLFQLTIEGHNEHAWNFVSTQVIDVLVAVKIGEVSYISFKEPFKKIYNVQKYRFPSGVQESGYGRYRFHVSEDLVSGKGFKVMSSFETGEVGTKSRLPFFFGFRCFGQQAETPNEPVWKIFLLDAVKYSQQSQWHISVLHSAFALESFLDSLLNHHLQSCGIHDAYIEHVLRVGDRKEELHAINQMILSDKYTKSKVESIYKNLNKKVFTIRNGLAHGRSELGSITRDVAHKALLCVTETIWDFSASERKHLLATTGPIQFEQMIDQELIQSCQLEN